MILRLEGAHLLAQLIEQLTLHSFSLFFLLLLPLDVFAYLVFIQSNGTDTVPARPSVTPPIAAAQAFVLYMIAF